MKNNMLNGHELHFASIPDVKCFSHFVCHVVISTLREGKLRKDMNRNEMTDIPVPDSSVPAVTGGILACRVTFAANRNTKKPKAVKRDISA